jgi:DNA ligase-1
MRKPRSAEPSEPSLTGLVRPPASSKPALFVDLASASERVARSRGRLQKQSFLVEALKKVPDDEIAAAVGWLVEQPLCGPLGVGPTQLWALSKTKVPAEAMVTLRDVEASLEEARGAQRDVALARVSVLFAKLTELERALFVGALTGSLRQGSLEGVMLPVLAKLSGHDEEAVRRAVMVTGSIARAADALLGRGRGAAPPSALVLFRPVAPMLASPAASLEDALAGAWPRLVEWKVDGLRAQIHKKGERVAIFSRQGNDMTAGCGPILGSLAAMNVDSAVLDGEVVLVGPTGVARPFQDTFSAVASRATPREGERLRVYLFDCVHHDGQDLLDEPLSVRHDALVRFAPEELRMPALLATNVDDARAFERAALDAGHEGVMVKDVTSPYRFGSRGRAWQKVKQFTTVELVVLAAEWGHGRRQGYLSNLHLGARREDRTFAMVGKTFKGLTDGLLRWQTERLQALATETDRHVVYVRPELVVEIRFNDVQRSPRYPGGVALRFARVVRYRQDKSAAEADTLQSLIARVPKGPLSRAGLLPKRRARRRKAGTTASFRSMTSKGSRAPYLPARGDGGFGG